MPQLLPLFLKLTGRRVLLVGGGAVAAGKLRQLLAADADVHVVAPVIDEEIQRSGASFEERPFIASDLDGAWLVVAAGPPEINRHVAAAAETRHIFVNAVDDPVNATAYLGGVVRRDDVTFAISTSGDAPALTALLREGLDAVLPPDLGAWVGESRRQRAIWKRDRVPIDARRPLLLEALNGLYDGTSDELAAEGSPSVRGPSRQGHVSLVGAGPGDPGLLTRRAVARLRSADLVLYDALVDRRVLKLARRAQRFFVGKRPGRHAMTQPAINTLMIRAARRGKRVVRLKGGDPFVFGRGGEEAMALRAAGVELDVVPGITSAIAAPTLAGIPVTHRGVSGAFLVVGGHDESAFASAIRGVEPGRTTIVVLMGMGRRAVLAQQLLDIGWGGRTPAAIIADASKSEQTVWRGTVEELASGQIDLQTDGPATIVIGHVAALATRARGARATPKAAATGG